MVYILSVTLLLNSTWALILAEVMILVYLIHTHREDRMLPENRVITENIQGAVSSYPLDLVKTGKGKCK